MRKLGLGVALAFTLTPALASAGIIDVYGQLQGGGMYGQGVAGGQKDNDFFQGAAGPAAGFKLGAEVMFIDAWVEHDEYLDGSGLLGTWTQLMVGFDVDVPLGTPAPGKTPRLFGDLGIGVGYGMGTGQQVELPLDNGQLSDKGFVGELRFGLEYRLNRMLSLGLSVPVTYGYLFKNLTDANDEDNQYQSVHATGLVYLKLHLGWK